MNSELIDQLQSFPSRLEAVMSKFTAEQRKTPDKGGEGWSPEQLAHHITDAHAQAYYRIKWMISEHYSVIKPFDQNKWMDLSLNDDYKASLDMLRGICSRWSTLMTQLEPEAWDTQGWHPEGGLMTVKGLFEYYLKHGEGHLKRMEQALQ